MPSLRSVKTLRLRRTYRLVHSSSVPYASYPLIRYVRGSGRGLRSYPYEEPGYCHGLTLTSPHAVPGQLVDRTAAERFLGNYDTVEAVFNQIRVDPEARRDPRMLLDLMLATKAFHHHAATIVWSSLGDLGIYPLLDIITDLGISKMVGDGYVNSVYRSVAHDLLSLVSFP